MASKRKQNSVGATAVSLPPAPLLMSKEDSEEKCRKNTSNVLERVRLVGLYCIPSRDEVSSVLEEVSCCLPASGGEPPRPDISDEWMVVAEEV